jgi:hypothetical protein
MDLRADQRVLLSASASGGRGWRLAGGHLSEAERAGDEQGDESGAFASHVCSFALRFSSKLDIDGAGMVQQKG